MKDLVIIANETIRSANMGKLLTFPNGATYDIIKEILATDKVSSADTALFAESLRGKTLDETLSNVWHFLKRTIRYKLDPFGIQYVKTPARTWKDKFADCKCFSIFVGSILRNLNIPFSYRFVSFQPSGDFTHVYVVVPNGSGHIIMDVVMPAYNTEKPYKSKTDYDMTKIYRLSGIPQAMPTKIIDLGNKDLSQITPGEMDLLLARDRLVTEKGIIEDKRGVGSLIAEKYQNSIDMIDDAISAVNDYMMGSINDIDTELALISKQATSGAYSVHNQVAGIGSIEGRKNFRKQNRIQLKHQRRVIKRRLTPKQIAGIWDDPSISGIGKTPKFLKKVAAGVKKAVKATGKGVAKAAKATGKVAKVVVKTAVKVATAPLRLLAKGILEVTLPKAAPFFLYLFITDPKTLASAPAKVKAKRAKAEKLANFIVNGIGMKRDHFMAICRNGIMKQYKKSPENVIADMMGNKISGIGVIGIAAVTALISIIQKISALIKKKGDKVSVTDSPDGGDWKSLSAAAKSALLQQIKESPENTSAMNTDSKNPENPITSSMDLPGSDSGNGNSYPGSGSSTSSQKETFSAENNSGSGSNSGGSGGQYQSGGKSIWNSLS